MSGTTKVVLTILGVIAALWFVTQVVIPALVGLIVPLAIIFGIGYVLYSMVSRKALGGGRRILP